MGKHAHTHASACIAPGHHVHDAGGFVRAVERACQERGLRLTPIRARVLRLVADGHDTAEIARELCYSERTVKNVLHDLTTRLQLRNRSHAVAYALREGLI